MTQTNPSKPRATCVKFTETEYERIQKASHILGETIPQILKSSFFKGPEISVLLTNEDAKSIMSQLQKIGTNVNQIAKHLNAGIREGFNDGLNQAVEQLKIIRQYISGVYGHR